MEDLTPYIGDGSYHGVELIKPLEVGKLKFVIVGTGRCGTVYMAKLLTSLGYPCGHEAIFRHDGFDHALARMENREDVEVSLIAKLASHEDEARGVSWFRAPMLPLVADSSYMVAPFLDRPELKDVKIIHVVRQPMKVINSFVEGFHYFLENVDEEHKPYHEFIYENIPELRMSMDPVSKAALYYIRWNEMIEEKGRSGQYFRYRIEADINKLLIYLGINRKPYDIYENSQSNHKLALEDKFVSFGQVPIKKIREQLVAINNRYYQLKVLA